MTFECAPPPSPDETPVEIVNAGGDPRLVLICDHASNARPADLGDLGLGAADLGRHIAYDVGARGVTLALAAALGAPAALATFSRLVIDPNRGERDPTLIRKIYDRSIVPGNARADAAERDRRMARFYRPYHAAVAAMREDATARAGAAPLLVSIHSYAPALAGRPPRPWHVGVLWDSDPKSARALLDALRRDPDLCVGDNQPYVGALPGDTMARHGTETGAPHVLIEIRNDLIGDAAGQAAWADRLAPILDRMRDRDGA